MKILIVDNTPNRREAFCNYLKEVFTSAAIEIIGCENVWGNGPQPDPLQYLEPGDVNFVHANGEVNRYWDTFVRGVCQNYYVVCFSGAGIGGLAWDNPKHFPFRETINTQDDIRSKWFLKEFIEAIQNNDLEPFDKLIGYNPLLEAKLELLHACLTPEGKKQSNTQLEKVLSFYDNSEQAKLRTLYNAIPEEDCFSEKYLNALSALRDALLPEHEYMQK